MKYNDNGEIKELHVKSLDTLPTGSIIEYAGEEVPDGWVEYEIGKDVSIGTEPNDTGVQFEVSRNLFDKSQIQIGKAWNLGTNNARAIVQLVVTPNTTYTISVNDNDFEGIYYYEKANQNDTTTTVGISSITNKKTLTTNSNSKCLGIQFNKENISIDDFINLKLQIEKGPNDTEYEPYVVPNIKVYGETIVSKNIYSTEEQVIGTWIDGKPLYRKVISTTTPNVTTEGTAVWSQVVIENVSNFFIEGGYFIFNDITFPIIFTCVSNNANKYLKSNGAVNKSTNRGVAQISSNTTTFSNLPAILIVNYTKTTD